MLNEQPRTVPSRMLIVDALRALASTIIALHHFSVYGPLADCASPLIGAPLAWMERYGRVAVVLFFVIGGFVMARSMSSRNWNFGQFGRYVARRYCRLGIPYLGAIVLAIVACAVGRAWLPEHVVGASSSWKERLVGSPPTVPQVLVHVVFLQDILGYESLSAGLWFVCINFQLSLLFALMYLLRDVLPRASRRGSNENSMLVPMLLGWALALASLFYFNLDLRHQIRSVDSFEVQNESAAVSPSQPPAAPGWDVWAVYFFAHFFMGVMVYYGLKSRRWQALFWLYVAAMLAALAYNWRLRLAVSLVVGLVLFFSVKSGLAERWPRSRVIAYLGRTSYSMFLIHFPVLILVATLWVSLNWTSPWGAVAGLVTAFFASLAMSMVFYRGLEAPAARLSRD